MTVSAKNRRKIEIDARNYVWWVAEDEESPFVPYSLALTVISEDRRFFIRYHLNQPAELRHVTVLGSEFRVAGCGGRWRRFRCASFGSASTVSPRDVASLVRWSLTGSDPLLEVDYRCQPFAPMRS